MENTTVLNGIAPARVGRLAEGIGAQDCAAGLFAGQSHAAHIAAYSRPFSGPTATILSAEREITLVVPAYEVEVARREAEADRVVGYGGEGFGLELEPLADLIQTCLGLLGDGDVGIASEIPGLEERLAARRGRACRSLEALVHDVRLRKDEWECHAIRRAFELSLLGQQAVGEGAVPGAREIDLYTAAQAAAQRAAGEPIEFGGDLLAGDRSALVCSPVAIPGERALAAQEVVVCDIALRHRGYWGDTARTFITGEQRRAADAIAFIEDLLERTVERLLPGLPAAEPFAFMAKEIADRFPDGRFPHHGGHGIGVTVFEDPHLIPGQQMPLAAGMVIAVEPGVYLPGAFGVRVENVYLVTEAGGVDLRALPNAEGV